MFGEPVSVRSRGTGSRSWRYEFSETRTADTSFITRVGSWFGRFFGMRGVRSPANVAYSNTVRHRLSVVFDSDGVVED